jgi:hypothetical protein
VTHLSEINFTFLQGMLNRTDVSYFKYGAIADGAPKLNLTQCAINCMRKYAQTGNTEYLIDAGNYLMFEFMHPKHPEAHFKPTDDAGSAHRISAVTGRPDARNNQNIGKRHGE